MNKIAIVIPYYKKNYFTKTLESLANQTDNRFNVYVGNDNSPEDPSDIIEAYSAKLNLTYHKFEKNLGGTSLTQQWERCIDQFVTEEEWIIILGDDDFPEENYIEEFYKHLPVITEKNVDLVRFSAQQIHEILKEKKKFVHPTFETEKEFLIRKLSKQTQSSLSEYVFKKEIYNKHRFYNFPMAWHSDDYAWSKYGVNGIYSVATSHMNVMISEHSISGNSKDYNDKKNRASYLFYKKLYEENYNEYPRELKLIILNRLLWFENKFSWNFVKLMGESVVRGNTRPLERIIEVFAEKVLKTKIRFREQHK